MKYLNLDINHYLSDKDKGEKPIAILIKGAVIYLILLIVSILVISYAHHIGWPKELKPKEKHNTNVNSNWADHRRNNTQTMVVIPQDRNHYQCNLYLFFHFRRIISHRRQIY